jgi:hypothetical protein
VGAGRSLWPYFLLSFSVSFFSFFLFFLPFPFRVTTRRTWLRNSKSTCKKEKEKGEQKIQHYMVDQIYLAISVIGVSLPLFISLVFFFFFSQEENKAHHCKVILD